MNRSAPLALTLTLAATALTGCSFFAVNTPRQEPAPAIAEQMQPGGPKVARAIGAPPSRQGGEQSGTEAQGAEQPGGQQQGTGQEGTGQPGTEESGTEESGGQQPGTEQTSNGESADDQATGDQPAGDQAEDPASDPATDPSGTLNEGYGPVLPPIHIPLDLSDLPLLPPPPAEESPTPIPPLPHLDLQVMPDFAGALDN